jgi:hypothetical protein
VDNKIEDRNIVAYGGFKKSISGYTCNRMQNPTIKFLNAIWKSQILQSGGRFVWCVADGGNGECELPVLAFPVVKMAKNEVHTKVLALTDT